VIAIVTLTIVLTVVIGGWLAKRPYPKTEKKTKMTVKERMSPTPSEKVLQSEEPLSAQKNKRKRVPKVFDDEEPKEEIEEKKTKKIKSRSKSSTRSKS